MAYNGNRQYNTRNSVGRYNTPGQFVAAGNPGPQQYRLQQQQPPQSQQQPSPPQLQQSPPPQLSPQHQRPPNFQPPLPLSPAPANPVAQQGQEFEQEFAQRTIQSTNSQQQQLQNSQSEIEMKMESDSETLVSEDGSRPPWMKNRLAGFKKIHKRERRRRQNQHLRRLITPKNALMILNEMMLNEQLTNQQFKVEPSEGNNQYYTNPRTSFCADLTLNGVNYKGYGENKLQARNAAAEQAIRDLIIERMRRAVAADSGGPTSAPSTTTTTTEGEEEGGDGSEAGEPSEADEALPMIQLASFALHKLFSEWEYDGHKVPQLRPPAEAGSAGAGVGPGAGGGARVKAARPPKRVPVNAAAMHPSMLLTYMRSQLEYRELGVQGDRPQNMTFTMGVDVDGATYIGKASNKKEARKMAAKAACTALFGVQFDESPTATIAIPPS